MSHGYAIFDTAVGRCGIAWSEQGITAVQLPEATERSTIARLVARHPSAKEASPPSAVRDAIAAVVALLAGEPRDLAGVPLDMNDVPAFDRGVYEIARTIPPGATLAYGEIAARLGDPGLARAVGQSLGRNPFAIIVPCHRVLAADGGIGGFSASGGTATKSRLLAIESAQRSLRFTRS